MNKLEKIDFINSMAKYLNLTAVCQLYNLNHPKNKIDYNNLRVVLKKQSINRLSEDKINSFINFIQNYFVPNIFKYKYYKKEERKDILKQKINNSFAELNKKIMEEIDNEL